VGYGVTGHNLAHVLRATRIPYCVVEMNPTFVRKARRDGAPTIVGDATRMSILQHAGIGKAHALVLAINDPRAVERIIAQVSALYPRLFTLVRVRFVQNIEPLYAKGAKLVIPEDFETSIEIAAHLLKEFRVPGNIINAQLASLRAGGYGLMRGKPADRVMTLDLIKILEQAITETFYLSEGSSACGQTLQELDLRAQTGCSVIAVVRQGKPNTNPGADFQLAAGDVLVLVGAHEQLDSARLLLGKED
ncbi:MAG: NAD-binding protein, partial [Candidatus Hydrogenedentes bacterium]|nr:NAD-binding protein [Candidatus Hydrogenedentota bacterium]